MLNNFSERQQGNEKAENEGNLKKDLSSIPVFGDALHAEAMSTWCGCRVGEYIKAYGALELFFT